MITLIIVDCQNDKITGTISVKGAKNAVEEIKSFIKKNTKSIGNIIFTLLWHPYNHSSFKSNGGLWSRNCVQHTPGACIEPKLLKYVQSTNIPYQFSLRGAIEEVEEIGAFSDIDHVSDLFGARIYLDICEIDEDSEVIVCGISGDYSVKSTVQNLINGNVIPKLFMKGIASTDNGTILRNFIKEQNLKIV